MLFAPLRVRRGAAAEESPPDRISIPAKQIGATIPPEVLARANKVIK
jgi:hypothetical protein